MANIKFLGLDQLDNIQKDKAIILSERYYGKIGVFVNEPEIIVHFKLLNKEGSQKHFFIKARVNAPNLMFESEQDDWDLSRALHKVFNNLENEIRKKLKL